MLHLYSMTTSFFVEDNWILLHAVMAGKGPRVEHPLSGFSEHYSGITHLSAMLHIYTNTVNGSSSHI